MKTLPELMRDWPIRRKLTWVILVTCSVALLLACGVLTAYQLVEFRATLGRDSGVLADMIARNTQAALAFQDETAAQQTMQALQAEPYVMGARLYDGNARVFAEYTRPDTTVSFPGQPLADGVYFESDKLLVYRPVSLNGRHLGTIALQTSLEGTYVRLRIFIVLALIVLIGSVLVAFILSARLQKPISGPILYLAETARRIAGDKDFAVRVPVQGQDEAGQLTGAFNQLLASIEERDKALRNANGQLRAEVLERQGAEARVQSQLERLELLHRITRAIGDRHDLDSIFQVVIRTVEEHLPVDFCCLGIYDGAAGTLRITRIGARMEELGHELAQTEAAVMEIGRNGISHCINGQLVSEPDISASNYPFFRKLADRGLRSIIAAPLVVESRVFGILISARVEPNSFSSGEAEFLRQLSEHVALAAHQTQLYDALQRAYEDLRQTQQAVMQQERLRALGQMASGIAHDINNAISPAALYTESLLENEPGLSPRARDYLGTIQHALDDVAQTVSRMKEFYRQRQPQLVLVPVQLNVVIQQVIDLSRARWNDIPQQRGIVVRMETELDANVPAVLGVESEIREALVNLVFNAVDAMPEGGTITLRTRLLTDAQQVHVEVGDTGVGMDEDTRRRCFEPFFTTKGERGTGLGLAMVHGIARRNNAEIEVDSAPGQGTTIRLVFPIATAVAGPVSSAVSPPIVRRLRILLIDDDPLLIKSLRDVLEIDGHVVASANGGREGVDLFAKSAATAEAFAVVITDLGMPHMNGRQVALEIKKIDSGVPIILLSGWGQRLQGEGEIPHIFRVLSKPPKLREIREALAEAVQSAAT